MCPNVLAEFSYLEWQELYETEKPFEVFINLVSNPTQQRRTNLVFKTRDPESVTDVREKEHQYKLDIHGFQFAPLQTGLKDFEDVRNVEQGYFTEIVDLIKSTVDGADQVMIFDWRLRQSTTEEQFNKRVVDLASPIDKLMPATHPHVDQSDTGARNRAYFHLKDTATQLLQGRFRIINVWRPLSTVKNWPLALCDARTVQQSDLVATDFVRQTYVGETYYLLPSQEHKWYYLSNQTANEATLLKMYDSEQVEGKRCPHASFSLNGVDTSVSRDSIEVRALVFTHPKYMLKPICSIELNFKPTIIARRNRTAQSLNA